MSSVDEWRRHQLDIPGRAEAIRRLVERGPVYHSMRNIADAAIDLLVQVARDGRLKQDEIDNMKGLASWWDTNLVEAEDKERFKEILREAIRTATAKDL